jgi:hypothetical protein
MKNKDVAIHIEQYTMRQPNASYVTRVKKEALANVYGTSTMKYISFLCW